MKISTWLTALFSLCSVLAAEDQALPKPTITGLWKESAEGKTYFHFQDDGIWRIFTREEDPEELGCVDGTWKLDAESGKILSSIGLSGWEKEGKTAIIPRFDGEDKVTLIDEGKMEEEVSYTRMKGNLEAKQLVGFWKGAMKQDAEGITKHFVTHYKDDGKAAFKSMTIHSGIKIYCISEQDFQWRVTSGFLVESFLYDGETSVEISEVTVPSEDKLVQKYFLHADALAYDLSRSTDDNIPEPPEGFRKVSEEEFQEALDGE